MVLWITRDEGMFFIPVHLLQDLFSFFFYFSSFFLSLFYTIENTRAVNRPEHFRILCHDVIV